MNEGDIRIIRESFHNFLCALIEESGLEGSSAKQGAIAIILEEIMSICKTDKKMDLFALKPILRLAKNIFIFYGDNTPIPLEKEKCYDTIMLIDSILPKIKSLDNIK